MDHKWEEEEVDGGPIGTDIFWICKQCGAGGGPTDGWDVSGVVFNRQKEDPPATIKSVRREPTASYSGGSTFGHVKLGSNCEEAQRIVAELKTRPAYQEERINRYKWYAEHALKTLEKRHGSEGRLFEEGRRWVGGFYVGIPDGEKDPGQIRVYARVIQAIPADIGWNDSGWTLRAPGPGQLTTEKWIDNYNDLLREMSAFFERKCSCDIEVTRRIDPQCAAHCFPLGEGAMVPT